MNEKKLLKKRKKFAIRMKVLKNILCVEDPKVNIALCNGGQATGLEKEHLLEAFRKILPEKPFPEWIAENGESHSFLVFDCLQDSVLFYETYNGKLKYNIDKSPIYMTFVENVPKTEIIITDPDPSGLHLFEDFISEEEERQFLKFFDTGETNLKNRQVKHFGYEFRYGSNDVDLNSPLEEGIPEICDKLWSRLTDRGVSVERPTQLTVNKYLPGQGIPSHVDRHSPFGPTVVSLSLGSSVVMDVRHRDGRHVPVCLRPRMCAVMTGEMRYDWQHGIRPRDRDPVVWSQTDATGRVRRLVRCDTVARQTRVSLTFRWVRVGPCDCPYPALCDSRDSATEMDDSVASRLEELHVHQVYEHIAPHFSVTRRAAWPVAVMFVKEWASLGSVMVDLGAGNGKCLGARAGLYQVAGERSAGLLRECAARVRDGPDLVRDCVRLDVRAAPLRDGAADLVLCVAVVHHLCTGARRKQAISTIARLLRTGGRALITVWAKDQKKSNYLSQNKDQVAHKTEMKTVAGVKLPVHENRTNFQHDDLLVPWKLRNVNNSTMSHQAEQTLLRYYHVFQEHELEQLCTSVPNLLVEKSFYEEGNWCVICKKI